MNIFILVLLTTGILVKLQLLLIIFCCYTRNSFPGYSSGTPAQGHSEIKVAWGGTSRFLSKVVQQIKLLPETTRELLILLLKEHVQLRFGVQESPVF